MVAALVARLSEQGFAPHILSRGHGGRLTGPHLVDPERDSAADVGDEPLMLAARAPVWIARDRVAGAHAAVDAGAKLLIMDDGYQNPHLEKNVSIVMVDAVQGFGNARVIPAGPLREPVSEGLARADLVVLTGTPDTRQAAISTWQALRDVKLVGATLVPLRTGLDLAGERVVAFAGIGRPEKFFSTLRALGAEVIAAHPFADHAPYTTRVLRRLLSEARGQDALLVTTEKDAVRLPNEFRREVLTLQIALEPEDWGPIDALIKHLVEMP